MISGNSGGTVSIAMNAGNATGGTPQRPTALPALVARYSDAMRAGGAPRNACGGQGA